MLSLRQSLLYPFRALYIPYNQDSFSTCKIPSGMTSLSGLDATAFLRTFLSQSFVSHPFSFSSLPRLFLSVLNLTSPPLSYPSSILVSAPTPHCTIIFISQKSSCSLGCPLEFVKLLGPTECFTPADLNDFSGHAAKFFASVEAGD